MAIHSNVFFGGCLTKVKVQTQFANRCVNDVLGLTVCRFRGSNRKIRQKVYFVIVIKFEATTVAIPTFLGDKNGVILGKSVFAKS